MGYKCRLKAILADLDIKHGEFADRVGIDKSTFSAIVNNKSLPSFETLYEIVEELRRLDPEIKLGDIWIKQKAV
jgi:DNA-binding XRE family transcriptional regulator